MQSRRAQCASHNGDAVQELLQQGSNDDALNRQDGADDATDNGRRRSEKVSDKQDSNNHAVNDQLGKKGTLDNGQRRPENLNGNDDHEANEPEEEHNV